jgi:hypothetical protein
MQLGKAKTTRTSTFDLGFQTIQALAVRQDLSLRLRGCGVLLGGPHGSNFLCTLPKSNTCRVLLIIGETVEYDLATNRVLVQS